MPQPENPDLREEIRTLTQTLDRLLAVQAFNRAFMTATVGLCVQVAQTAGIEALDGEPLLDWFARTRREEIEMHLVNLDAEMPAFAAIVRELLAREL